MTNREFHLQCRKNETLAFLRVLNALPHDKFDYTPHEKSQTVARIVWTLVGEAQACVELIGTGKLTFGAPPELAPAQMIDTFERVWEELLQKIEGTDEATPADALGRAQADGEPVIQGSFTRRKPT